MICILKTLLSEWKLFFRDRAALLVLVVASLFYAFYYPLPYLHEVARDLPVGVVDHSQTALSRQLMRYADATSQVEVSAHYPDMSKARAAMAEGQVFGILEIPASFENDIRSGRETSVGIYVHAGYFMVYGSIARGLSFAAGTLGAGIEIRRLQAKGYPESVAMRLRDPFPMVEQVLYNATGGYASYIVPAVLIVILQQTLLIGMSILGGARGDRHLPLQQGRPEAAAPLYARWLGRGFAYLLHYGCFILFYHAVVYPFFNFPSRGEWIPMLLFGSFFLMAVIQMGLLISQFFRHRESAMQILVYCSLPFLFASGFSWPLSAMPAVIRAIFWLVPSTHAVPAWIVIQQQNASVADVVPHLIPLGVLTLLYGFVGYLLLARHEAHRRPVTATAAQK